MFAAQAGLSFFYADARFENGAYACEMSLLVSNGSILFSEAAPFFFSNGS
jgi:hypothetical protein